jgi:hypothetical protein
MDETFNERPAPGSAGVKVLHYYISLLRGCCGRRGVNRITQRRAVVSAPPDGAHDAPPHDGESAYDEQAESYEWNDESEPCTDHQKSQAGCQWIHRAPSFGLGFGFLGLVRLFSHDRESGVSQLFASFWVGFADQAACFAREPFYFLFPFLLRCRHLSLSLSYIGGNVNAGDIARSDPVTNPCLESGAFW